MGYYRNFNKIHSTNQSVFEVVVVVVVFFCPRTGFSDVVVVVFFSPIIGFSDVVVVVACTMTFSAVI